MPRDLLTEPAWRAEDLGLPLPDDPHAVSVALPRWEDVVDYEESRPRVTEKMRAGYPRFFLHPLVAELFETARKRFAAEGEGSLVFPSERAAEGCRDYVKERAGVEPRVEPWDALGLRVVSFPEALRATAREYWRYCGDTVSSRLAAAALAGKTEADLAETLAAGAAARRTIRERLAGLYGVEARDVFLFPSGMAAVTAAHRLARRLLPGKPTAQLDFPYVDALKVQREFGGARFFETSNAAALEAVRQQAEAGEIAGVFCEIPSNPLLRAAPLHELAPALRRSGVPLMVDDTVATVVNVNVLPFADCVTSSLTKAFSGTGNVLAGALTLNPASPRAAFFRAALAELAPEDGLWCEDAIALEQNSRDFPQRVRRMNANAAALVETLRAHPAVEVVHYPEETPAWLALRRPDGGNGCLFSFVLKNPEEAPRVYDRLRVSKGPSLGTNFTLCCPYTLLAHYQELEWTTKCGVAAHLLRVSAGIEDTDDLVRRFREALG